MKVLVACEESQEVCKAFREKGHMAYSCDIMSCSGGHPEWHIRDDVLKVLSGGQFITMDGMSHYVPKWDMIIAFPPCTHLAVSGAAWFEKKRTDGRQREGIEFFCNFLEVECEKVVIENPVGIISGDYIPKYFPDLAERFNLPQKPTQIIQPYFFGDSAKKTTCLWLKGLPELQPTNIVDCGEIFEYKGKNGRIKKYPKWMFDALGKSKEERQRIRSKTFEGVAKAMAEQWGNHPTEKGGN
jgi:site-specific DNA-cytosine methylase